MFSLSQVLQEARGLLKMEASPDASPKAKAFLKLVERFKKLLVHIADSDEFDDILSGSIYTDKASRVNRLDDFLAAQTESFRRVVAEVAQSLLQFDWEEIRYKIGQFLRMQSNEQAADSFKKALGLVGSLEAAHDALRTEQRGFGTSSVCEAWSPYDVKTPSMEGFLAGVEKFKRLLIHLADSDDFDRFVKGDIYKNVSMRKIALGAFARDAKQAGEPYRELAGNLGTALINSDFAVIITTLQGFLRQYPDEGSVETAKQLLRVGKALDGLFYGMRNSYPWQTLEGRRVRPAMVEASATSEFKKLRKPFEKLLNQIAADPSFARALADDDIGNALWQLDAFIRTAKGADEPHRVAVGQLAKILVGEEDEDLPPNPLTNVIRDFVHKYPAHKAVPLFTKALALASKLDRALASKASDIGAPEEFAAVSEPFREVAALLRDIADSDEFDDIFRLNWDMDRNEMLDMLYAFATTADGNGEPFRAAAARALAAMGEGLWPTARDEIKAFIKAHPDEDSVAQFKTALRLAGKLK